MTFPGARPAASRQPSPRLSRCPEGQYEKPAHESRGCPGSNRALLCREKGIAVMTMSPDRVLGASAKWISRWFPPHSVHTDLGWLEYYLLDGCATVMRVEPGEMTAADLVPKVLTELWRQRAVRAHWRTGPRDTPGGVDQVLMDLGASVHETVDICGLSLDNSLPAESLAQGASARPVRTRDDVAQFERTSALAWDIRLRRRRTSNGPSPVRPRVTSSAAGMGRPLGWRLRSCRRRGPVLGHRCCA